MKEFITEVPGISKTGLPLSMGVVAEGKFLFISGFGPYDPAIGGFNRGPLTLQTELTLQALEMVMHKVNAKKEDVISCRVFLQQLTERNFSEMNAVYEKFFGSHRPARTTVGCQLLNIDIEIDCIVNLS